jgi:hypothetical protein
VCSGIPRGMSTMGDTLQSAGYQTHFVVRAFGDRSPHARSSTRTPTHVRGTRDALPVGHLVRRLFCGDACACACCVCVRLRACVCVLRVRVAVCDARASGTPVSPIRRRRPHAAASSPQRASS